MDDGAKCWGYPRKTGDSKVALLGSWFCFRIPFRLVAAFGLLRAGLLLAGWKRWEDNTWGTTFAAWRPLVWLSNGGRISLRLSSSNRFLGVLCGLAILSRPATIRPQSMDSPLRS